MPNNPLQPTGAALAASRGMTVSEAAPESELVWYVDGYNAVSGSRLRARFGKDIFAECAEEARAAWEQAHRRE